MSAPPHFNVDATKEVLVGEHPEATGGNLEVTPLLGAVIRQGNCSAQQPVGNRIQLGGCHRSSFVGIVFGSLWHECIPHVAG